MRNTFGKACFSYILAKKGYRMLVSHTVFAYFSYFFSSFWRHVFHSKVTYTPKSLLFLITFCETGFSFVMFVPAVSALKS